MKTPPSTLCLAALCASVALLLEAETAQTLQLEPGVRQVWYLRPPAGHVYLLTISGLEDWRALYYFGPNSDLRSEPWTAPGSPAQAELEILFKAGEYGHYLALELPADQAARSLRLLLKAPSVATSAQPSPLPVPQWLTVQSQQQPEELLWLDFGSAMDPKSLPAALCIRGRANRPLSIEAGGLSQVFFAADGVKTWDASMVKPVRLWRSFLA